MALQLEVGKYYRTRDGRKVKIDEETGMIAYPFTATNGHAYTPNGKVSYNGVFGADLIAEWELQVETPTTLPAQPPMTFYPLQRMIDCDDLPVTRQEAKEMMRAIREAYAKMEGNQR